MIISQREATTRSYERYSEALQRPFGLAGVDTGFHDINMATGGHLPTKIITFAMRSGGGKTACIVPMAAAAGRVQNNKRSELLVLSWEMESSYLIDRYVCWKTGTKIMELRYPKSLSEGRRKEIVQAYREASVLPVQYHHNSTNITSLQPILDRFVNQTKAKAVSEGITIQPVVILDFIGRIQGNGKYGSKTYDIEGFMQGLKESCNNLGLSAFLLAQINRSADLKDHPEVSDISDSASIEANSDTLIIGHRPAYYGKELMKDPLGGGDVPTYDKLLARIVKARESAPHDELWYCDMRYFRIYHRDHDWDTPYWNMYTNEDFWREQLIRI